jgi:hypothetical protein
MWLHCEPPHLRCESPRLHCDPPQLQGDPLGRGFSSDWNPDHDLNLMRIRIWFPTVLRIRIHRIHMFLDLLDPDPSVRGSVVEP